MSAKKTAASTTTGTAYSFQRFSSPEQRKGDSIRRQTELRDAYLKRTKLTLDTSLKFVEEGTSAYHGKHRSSDKYALGYFLSLVQSGRIQPGSTLIVESLDRLTREDVDDGLQLLLSLTNAGIRVVQLLPTEVVYAKPVDPMRLVMGIMELSRGNSESRMKSERIGAAWEAKRRKARETGEAMTAKCPHWLKKVGDKYEVIPERAAVVRRIFEMSADGQGITQIIKAFVAEGVTPFTRNGRWGNSYLGHILRGRTALGAYQPMRGGKPDGEPIEGFYPVVVGEKTYHLAQAGLDQRSHGGGQRLDNGINLFTGLMTDAESGDKIEFRCLRWKGRRDCRYVNALALQGQAVLNSFPVGPLETGVLRFLREINPADILPQHNTAASDVVALSAEHAKLEDQLRRIEDQLVGGEVVDVLVNAAKKLTAKKNEVGKRLAEARAKANNPASESWGTCQSLIEALDAAEDKHAAKLRLKGAIARVVENVVTMFVRNGKRSIAVVQLHFRETKAIRTIFVCHRPELTNPKEKTPAFTHVATRLDGCDGIDITTHARFVREVLEVLVEEKFWNAKFENGKPTAAEKVAENKRRRQKLRKQALRQQQKQPKG